jgi:hypothetical protein
MQDDAKVTTQLFSEVAISYVPFFLPCRENLGKLSLVPAASIALVTI